MEDDNIYNKNFIITNKSSIEKKDNQTEENGEKKDLQYLYQITGQNINISNLKKDIGNFLELTDYIFNDIKSISGEGKKVQKMKYNTRQKLDNQDLYNSKIRCFNANLNLYQKKLKYIKEKNAKFQNFIDFFKQIKNYGFLLDEKFDIHENDMVLDLDKIIIQHRFVKHFEDLINIKNKNFKIINKQNGEYELKSDFYDYYNNKYILNFNIQIKINNGQTIFISNELFEKYIRDKRIYLTRDIKENKELILFYIKYLLYKFFKEEINIIIKYQKNQSKQEQFINKGLNFNVQKYPNNLKMKCYYFDNLEIYFSISKTERQHYQAVSNYFLNNRRIPFIFNDLNDFYGRFYNNSANSSICYAMEYIRIFFDNILLDIKLSKNISNFVGEVKKNSNLTLENIIKNSIFVKNITNIGILLLKFQFNKFILYNNNFISGNYLNIFEISFGSYKIFFDYYEKDLKINNEIELKFDNNLNLTINYIEPYKTPILNLDKTHKIIVGKGRINFNYLYDIIANSAANFNYITGNKYIFKNNII